MDTTNSSPPAATAKLIQPRDSFKIWLQLWLENFSVPHCAQCGKTQELPPPYLEGAETVRLCYPCIDKLGLDKLGCLNQETELLGLDNPVVIGGLWNPNLKKLIYRYKFNTVRSKQLLNILAGVAITGWQQTEQHLPSLPSLSRLSQEVTVLTSIPKRLPDPNLAETQCDNSRSLLGLSALVNLLSARTGIPIAMEILHWRRPTKAQHTLYKRQERILNVSGGLQANKINISKQPKTIIVFDDIRTTGATLQAATEALQKQYPDSQIIQWALCQIPYRAWKSQPNFGLQ